MKKYLLYSFIALSSLQFFGCSNDEPKLDVKTDFEIEAFNYFENVSQYYPKEDVTMNIERDENGISKAVFELRGESKRLAELGKFAARQLDDDGTTCSSAISCGKALKKCLDNDQKGVIANGACFSADEYCVTCED